MAVTAGEGQRPRLSLATLLLGGFLLAVLLSGLCVIIEGDTPWCLRAGETILQTRGLPAHDPFSYTSHKPWLNHEWLAEVLLALTFRVGGFVGLGLLQGLVLAGVVGLLMSIQARRSRLSGLPDGGAGSAGPVDGLSLLAYAAAAALLRQAVAPRAQLFANVLFAATLALALADEDDEAGRGGKDARRRGLGLLIWTVPIEVLWTQIHGGSPHAVILLSLLLVARPSLRRAGFAALALALTCAGPYGYHVHEHFFGSKSTLPEIAEWRSLGYALSHGASSYLFYVGYLLAALFALVYRIRRGEPLRFLGLALLFFCAAGVRYLRFLTEAVMVATPVLAPLCAELPGRFWGWFRTGRAARIAGLGVGLAVLGLAVASSQRRPGIGLDEDLFPIGAVEFLRRTHPPGPMLNSYNFGGYLLWAYPQEPVFIDGRSFTVYSEEQVRDLLEVYEDPRRFAALSGRYRFRLAVLQRSGRGQKFLAWLRQQPQWRVVYEDRLAVVLVRGPQEN